MTTALSSRSPYRAASFATQSGSARTPVQVTLASRNAAIHVSKVLLPVA